MNEATAKLVRYGGDILPSAGMQQERGYVQHGVFSCYDHSVRVAYMSLWLAARLPGCADERALVRGALLHDYFLYDWHDPDPSHRWHGFHHARRALQNACADFELGARERDIIRKHMFPLNFRPPRYRESWIVCAADKLCATGEVVAMAKRRLRHLFRCRA